MKPAPVAASLALILAAGTIGSAYAQSTTDAPTATSESPAPVAADANSTQADTPPATPTGFWDRSNLLGDMGGLRTLLGIYGVTFSLQETSEAFGNFSGGVSKGPPTTSPRNST